MTAPVPQLSKRNRLDVNTGTTASPVWVQVKGLKGPLLPTFNRDTADPSTNDSGTWKSAPYTVGISWQYTGTYETLLYSGARDPGQLAIEAAALPVGDAQPAQIEIRIYDRFTTTAAGIFGTCSVETTGADNSGLEDMSFTLNGVGERTSISNPLGAAQVPLISTALPSAAAVTQLITITGSYFTGTTAVTIGGTAATDFELVSDNKIVAEIPAGSPGSAPIVVTNVAGASASKAYTRGA